MLLVSFRTWTGRVLQQIRGVNPFAGDCLPTRVSLFAFGRPALPFPHLWNYKDPIKIFETFYSDAEKETGSGKHNRYLYLAGLPPVLLSREPAIIKAVLGATGDKPGQFDRDTSPMAGIARATGEDSLLYSNGASLAATEETLCASHSAVPICFSRKSFMALSKPSARQLRKDWRRFVPTSGPAAKK